MEATAPKFEIKTHEDVNNKDYVFMIPNSCPSDQAKMILMSMYEHIVRFEMIKKAEQEVQKEEKPTEVAVEVVKE